MALPNILTPKSPFDILEAEYLNDMNENTDSLADGTGFNAGAIPTAAYEDGSVTDAKRTLGVSFSASADGSQGAFTDSTFTKVTFKTIQHNDGSAFDGTSVFTAPRAGKYIFTWAIQGTGNSTNVVASLYLNNSEIRRGYWSNHTGFNRASMGSVVVKLAANDTVDIYCYFAGTDRTPRSTPYTYFSGAFLGI